MMPIETPMALPTITPAVNARKATTSKQLNRPLSKRGAAAVFSGCTLLLHACQGALLDEPELSIGSIVQIVCQAISWVRED